MNACVDRPTVDSATPTNARSPHVRWAKASIDFVNKRRASIYHHHCRNSGYRLEMCSLISGVPRRKQRSTFIRHPCVSAY